IVGRQYDFQATSPVRRLPLMLGRRPALRSPLFPYTTLFRSPLTGLDAEVVAFLEREPKVGTMLGDIRRFVETWLPAYGQDSRSSLTVAVGCTGGRHRSVYLVERLGAYFRGHTPVLVRHRHLVPAA